MTRQRVVAAAADDVYAVTLRRRFASDLRTRGVLGADWSGVFDSVARHLFVPQFWVLSEREWMHVDAGHPRWLELVYSDQALVTRLTDGVASCSSTEPSLMLQMLAALDVDDESRVLEVGTGTGYNAGLLCARVGDDRVTSLDVDPDIVKGAFRCLGAAGFRPQVICGDGCGTTFAAGAFDRLIATCMVGRVPAAWLYQVRPGGIIVCPIGSGIVKLVVGDDATATGHFLPEAAYFMPASDAGMAAVPAYPGRPNYPAVRGTRLSPSRVADDPHVAFLASVMVPDMVMSRECDDHGRVVAVEAWAGDRSWVRITNGIAETAGPRSLYSVIHRAALHANRGIGSRSNVGVTVTPTHQTVWLGTPETVIARAD